MGAPSIYAHGRARYIHDIRAKGMEPILVDLTCTPLHSCYSLYMTQTPKKDLAPKYSRGNDRKTNLNKRLAKLAKRDGPDSIWAEMLAENLRK